MPIHAITAHLKVVMHNTCYTILKFSQKSFQKRLTKQTKHAIIRHKQKGGLQHDSGI